MTKLIMHYPIKHFLFFAALSLLIISCEDEPTKPEYPIDDNSDSVHITEVVYSLKTIHKTFFNPGFKDQHNIFYKYCYGIEIIVKLERPSQKNLADSMAISTVDGGNFWRDFYFNNEKLKSIYNDSLGGFFISFLSYQDSLDLRFPPESKWYIEIFNSKKERTAQYTLTANTSSFIIQENVTYKWHKRSELKIGFSKTLNSSSSRKIYVRLFDSERKEIKEYPIVQLAPGDSSLVIGGIPDETSFLRSDFSDENSGIKRSIISAYNPIPYKPDDINIDTLNESAGINQIEHIKNLDMILFVSMADNMMYMLDGKTYSQVWKRSFGQSLSFCFYSETKNLIYALLENNSLYSYNPATGEENFIYKATENYEKIYVFKDYAYFYSNQSSFLLLNLISKSVQNGSFSFYDAENELRTIIYNSYSKKLYVQLRDSYMFAFPVNSMGNITDGTYEYTGYLKNYTLIASPDGKRLYTGTGNTYTCSPTDNNIDLNPVRVIKEFTDIGFASDNIHFVSIIANTEGGSLYLYNTNLDILNKYETLYGFPMRVFIVGDEIRAILKLKDGRIGIQKFNLSSFISQTSGK